MSKFFAVTTMFSAIALGCILTGQEVKGNSTNPAVTDKIQTVPYRISLAFYDKHNQTFTHWCSGSVISVKWVLTAGSCFDKRKWPNKNATLVVLAGSAQLGANPGRSFHTINETVYYWWYFINVNGIAVNDIILISVAKPFEFSTTLQLVPLYDQDEETTAGSNAIVSGWGSVEQFHDPKNLNVSIISKYECNIGLHGGLTYTGQICALYYEQKNESSCPIEFDPGSPLTINGRLAGFLSWGTSPCASPDESSIYTEVGYFRDWIRNNTGA